MQKHVNLVDLVKSFPTNIFLQKLASIQKRTSPIKFAHLAEKSEKGSISNLSTTAQTPLCVLPAASGGILVPPRVAPEAPFPRQLARLEHQIVLVDMSSSARKNGSKKLQSLWMLGAPGRKRNIQRVSACILSDSPPESCLSICLRTPFTP